MKKLLFAFLLSWLALTSGYGQAISPYLAGQNAWMPKGYGGTVYNGQLDALWPIVQKSKVRMIRIGGNGVEFNMPSGPEYVALIDSIRRIGAEPMVQVSEGRGKYTAERAAGIVDYVNNVMQRRIKYWIIGNEPNLAGTRVTIDAAGVEAYTKAWATAMKQVDPSILIVGPECAFYDAAYYPALIGGAHDITGKDANGRYYVDIISFHTYPFNGTQTRAQVTASAQTLAGNVDRLRALMATANAKHNRTGANALRWALTEFNIDYANPTANTVEGVGVHSFLNGQYWAEVFGVGMQKEAFSIQPWSVHEGNGARDTGDLGYLDGSGPTIKPRSAYYHEMLVSENLRGTYLPSTSNQSLVTVFSSTFNDTTSVMLLNKAETSSYDFTVQLSAASVPGTSPLKINVPAGLNAAYTDKVSAQSTLVLLFNKQGTLLRKIVYSLQHAVNTLPPTYLKPGQNVTLASFTADKTASCVAPEQVTFTSSILGNYDNLTWNFGAGATPSTATGPGPFAVTYASAGQKTVTLTLQNADTTLVINKPNYVQVSTCARTPFLGAPVALPGVVKAVEFDNGGEGAAYHDSDVANRGAALDPTVPRATESVDTEKGGEGLGNIGYTAVGEWLKYSVNVQRTGLYKLTARVAANAAGGSFRVLVNDVDKTGPVTVPITGGFGVYQDVVVNNLYLEASPNATLKVEILSTAFNFSKFTFTEQDVTGLVVNRLYNATSTPDGQSDAVELLVTKDHLDIRGVIVKDFETNLTSDAGGKYQFTGLDLWKDLRIGTTIVLRKLSAGISGYAQDLDPTDSKLDLLLENTPYLTNLSGAGQGFNLTNTDMVLLKTGSASGTDKAIHAFATNNGGGTALFAAVTSPKLVYPAVLNTGSSVYPTNPTQTTADYNGSNTAVSTDPNRNWGNGFGTPNTIYINTLRNATFSAAGMVVNRIYNGSNDANGITDAVELLVVTDHFDARNLVLKDFETNNTADNGGKYRFNNTAFWQDLRLGTTIVLRRLAGPAGYVSDTDASDFTLDLLLDNATYLTNLAQTNSFNITQYDMVLLKTGTAAGVEGAIHAFATKGGGSNGVPSALFQSVRSAKLTSPDGTDAGGGSFHYPLNPNQRLNDYEGAKGAISKSTALNWGYGFGTGNVAYIQSLRDSVLAPPTALAATATGSSIALNWVDNSADETGFEVVRSLDGIAYTSLATLPAGSTSYSDECLNYATRYFYQVRAVGTGLASRYTAAVSTTTGARPVVTLPTLTAECAVTATAPTAPDNCSQSVTATTPDPTSFSAQGTYIINWRFAYADGTTGQAAQQVVVQDLTAPTVRTRNISVTLVNGAATITAADIDNGSTDACGLATLALDKTTFDCANLGSNPVLLTVTDVNGNTATAAATVTVIGATPAPAIAVTRLDQTTTGLDAQTMALGYGAQNLILTATNSTSAAEATTYAWSPATGLSNAAAANPTFAPTTAGTYTFILTATNEFGCSASTTVTIRVLDVRCGNKNDKVLVCHNGNELCIASSAVSAHLNHGDQLGSCAVTLRAQAETAAAQALLESFPNPFTDRTTVRFRPAATAAAQLQVYNPLGQLVATLYDAVAEAGREYEFTLHGATLPAGVYTCRLVSGGTVQTQRLVLVK